MVDGEMWLKVKIDRAESADHQSLNTKKKRPWQKDEMSNERDKGYEHEHAKSLKNSLRPVILIDD